MKKYFTLMICFVGICLMLTGCGKNTNEKIIGKWSSIDNKAVSLEYLKDGSFNIQSKPEGNWLILQDGRLKSTRFDKKIPAVIYTIVFDGDNKMTLTSHDGKSVVVIRQGN